MGGVQKEKLFSLPRHEVFPPPLVTTSASLPHRGSSCSSSTRCRLVVLGKRSNQFQAEQVKLLHSGCFLSFFSIPRPPDYIILRRFFFTRLCASRLEAVRQHSAKLCTRSETLTGLQPSSAHDGMVGPLLASHRSQPATNSIH